MNLFWRIKQKFLAYKYKSAKEIYILCLWAKWSILSAKFYKYNKQGEPLTIQWTDHNGIYEEYYVAPWYHESTGARLYSFNKNEIENVAKYKNSLDKV